MIALAAVFCAVIVWALASVAVGVGVGRMITRAESESVISVAGAPHELVPSGRL
ncbi:hypothetical protein RWH43_02830 [Microbacterium sp. KSW2-21]|uniref:Uncharacterized protein n=1 Tax=Microbacterium algihabitans TaxID=3075992 RepID=A0ABU3RS89_9MICO|nr:hypothetical protein [Microbacterium sp. KSW2-21]MDU0325684.1 hypothetical protein [Microbacterium sp. KSW2-21]